MMKITCKNILKCLLFLIVLIGFTFGEPADQCLDLIWEMRNCSTHLHVPDDCDSSKQSKLLTCAEAVADRVRQCPDKLGRKMINYFVTAYRLSDQVICQDNMHEELKEQPRCVNIAKWIIVGMAYITPGFLTDKGCRFFKTAFLITALAQDKNNCFKVIENYVNIMYSKSTCSKAIVETPTTNDVKNIIDVFRNIHLCWVLHSGVSKCNSTKSRRLQCVEDEVLNRIQNTHFKTLENNILHVTESTDKVICANKQLKDGFGSNHGCILYAQALGGFLMAEVNGYYTEEGCEGLKYREKYKLAIVEESCQDVLKTYWIEMKKILPCVEVGDDSSDGEKINLSLISLVVTLLSVLLV